MSPYLTYPSSLSLDTLDSHMIHIEAGTYFRGDENNGPIHPVRLDAFGICRFPVTQALWEAVMDENPSEFPSSNRPVETVSWEDCQRFLKTLNKKVENPFRLPTEAEWEYAARGGTNRGWKYAGSPNVTEVAHYGGVFGNTNVSQEISQPVGLRLPNELGLYDISGNIWEWCEDWYGEYPDISDQQAPIYAPTGPEDAGFRVMRGGSWGNNPENARVAYRDGYHPSDRYDHIGFRLARTV